MALSGMPPAEDAQTARLRKYEARLRRGWTGAHAELRRVQSGTTGASFIRAHTAGPESAEAAAEATPRGAAPEFQSRRPDPEARPVANAGESRAASAPDPAPSPVLD